MITLNDVYKSRNHYKVLVKTITFNHSKYIQDTLNGIAMQITNFPFVNVVLEDHSTDGEQEVIKTWMEQECDLLLAEYYDIPTAEVIIAPHKSNANCTFAVYFHKENLFRQKAKREEQVNPWRTNSEYEAMCEGDDYWTDSMKLQKQVDFLENNLDYSMCFHSAIEHYEHKDIPDKVFSKIRDKDYSGRFLFKNWIVPTASVLYRVSVVKSDLYKKVLNCKDFIYGDTPLFVTCAELGKVRGMSDIMSVYRRNEGGLTFGPKSTEEIKKFVNHILSFPQIFGEQYSNDSRLLVGRYLSDNVLGALRRGKCETARNIHSLTPSNCKYLYWLSNLFYPIRILFRWYAKFVRK